MPSKWAWRTASEALTVWCVGLLQGLFYANFELQAILYGGVELAAARVDVVASLDKTAPLIGVC